MRRRIEKVLFLPGALSTARVWDGVIENFRKLPPIRGREAIALEAANPISTVDSVEEAAAQLKAAYCLRETVVVGHSYGGYIALEVAKRSPELVGLGLVNSQARTDNPKTLDVRQKLIDIAKKGGVERVVALQKPLLLYSNNHERLLPVVSEMAHEVGTEAFIHQQHVSMTRPDSTAFLKSTDLPLWLCAGADDALLPALIAQNIHNEARRSSLCILEETGHMSHLEAPEKVAESLHSWLSTI